MPTRHFLDRADTRLSWLDFGGSGAVLLCLHGHFGCARNFAPLARALRGSWRIVALDQRGHGWSGHPHHCDRDAYVDDVGALLDRVSPGVPAHLIGHSLGGANAYQFAARHPHRTASLVVEDMSYRFGGCRPLGLNWPRRVDSADALLRVLALDGLDRDRYFLDSLHEFEDGWGFRCDPAWIARSQEALVGDWREDWQAVQCPLMLVHGARSWATSSDDVDQMIKWQPRARRVTLPGGHTLHDECPQECHDAVLRFLQDVEVTRG
jgi:pimeloyl-ACP methyl ester carboxylesterase